MYTAWVYPPDVLIHKKNLRLGRVNENCKETFSFLLHVKALSFYKHETLKKLIKKKHKKLNFVPYFFRVRQSKIGVLTFPIGRKRAKRTTMRCSES